MQDRRQVTRWQINSKAKVKLEGSRVFMICQIKDISFKGMQISLAENLPKDIFSKLSLVLTDEFTLDVEVWVVWRKGIDGFNVCGFYFTKIKDSNKEKIYQFMRTYFPKEMNKKWYKDFTEEKGGDKMQDRRIFERIVTQFPLRFLDANSGREGQAQAQDVSAKGIGFLTNTELQPHTPLEMWLQIPDQGEPLYTRGEVIWSKTIEPNKYRAGVNLEKADLMGLSRVLRTS